MANRYSVPSSATYNRYLGGSGFKGVDFTSPPAFVSPDRFSDSANVYRDYRSGLGSCVETVPGYRKALRFVDGSTPLPILAMSSWEMVDRVEDGRVIPFGSYVAIHVGGYLAVLSASSLKRIAGETYTVDVSKVGKDSQTIEVNGETVYLVKEVSLSFLSDESPVTMFEEGNNLYLFSSVGFHRVTPSLIAERIGDVDKQGAFAYDSKTYLPLAFVNGEEYQMMNVLNDGYAELYTEITVADSEDTGGNVTYTCSLLLHGKSELSYGYPDGAGTPQFYTNMRLIIDGEKIFESYSDPFSEHENVTVKYLYRGVEIKKPDYESSDDWQSEWNEGKRRPFDEIVLEQTIVSGIDHERKFTNESEIRIEVVGVKQAVSFPFASKVGGSPVDAIAGCTKIAKYMGRVFYMGNPKIPNIAFFSGRTFPDNLNDPSYIGATNYIEFGGESTQIKATISTSSDLIVLKESSKSGTEPTVFFVTGAQTGDDIVSLTFSVTQGAVGVGCSSSAINFMDDPVFSSEQGIYGINKLQTNLERSVTCRSNLVNGRLLSEDSEVLLSVWDGYLCVLCKSGHMYLADSRQASSDGYEWYFVDSVGTFVGDESIGTPIHDMEGQTLYDDGGEPIGVLTADGEWLDNLVYTGYIHQDIGGETVNIPIKYKKTADGGIVAVTADERTGGEFKPATVMISVGDSLWFGAENEILVLNSDLRGVPIGADDEGVDPQRIRRRWYSFCGHRYEAFVQTSYDDCGIPHLAKSTIARSTVIDMSTIAGSGFKASVYTAKDQWQKPTMSTTAIPDYGDTEFDNLSFAGDIHTVVSLREHTNRWSRKMYRIYSDEFCRPFGIHRISYRYKVAGRIKD